VCSELGSMCLVSLYYMGWSCLLLHWGEQDTIRRRDMKQGITLGPLGPPGPWKPSRPLLPCKRDVCCLLSSLNIELYKVTQHHIAHPTDRSLKSLTSQCMSVSPDSKRCCLKLLCLSQESHTAFTSYVSQVSFLTMASSFCFCF
jgi:hypothetical protein